MPILCPAAAPIVSRGFLFLIFLVLAAVLFASAAMFWLLVRRWTIYHHWSDLGQWADEHAMTLHGRDKAQLPKPLADLNHPSLLPVLSVSGKSASFVEMRNLHNDADQSEHLLRWHAAVKEIPTHWPPAALQPAKASSGLADLFALKKFPSMLPPDRLIAAGTDSASARRLAHSKVPALLPRDLALLLHGPFLIVDFSNRPFDVIELTRVAALLDQLATNLPPPPD